MKHSRNQKSPAQKSSAMAAGLAGLVGMIGLSGRASAAETGSSLDGYVSADAIDGVSSARALPDGSVELVFDDGRVVRIPADQVMSQNGGLFIAEAAAMDAASEGVMGSVGEFISDNALAVGAGVLGGGVGIAAAAGAFDDDDDVNDAPVFSSPTTASVSENDGGVAYTAQADDPEGEAVTYALSGGADAGLFAIDETTGALSFVEAPDFETPADADGDNQYEVVISASDGVNSVQKTVTVTVTDANEAPEFQNVEAISVVENATAAFTAMAVDPDGDPLTYTLEGADAALFAIDPETGVVTFLEAPDFEAPQDADGDNVYDVTVVASDGVNAVSQAYSVTVTDQIEISGGDGSDILIGSAASEAIDAGAGDDLIDGAGGRDFIATGEGADRIFYITDDPFDGVDVSAEGRQVSGNEDFVSDFDFASDIYSINAADYGIEGPLSFVSLDANAPDADIPDGANVIVLTNFDNDDNPDTPFLAVTAAEQIAELVETPGAGFFVYFNSNLNVNRLAYSSDLSDPNADLKIISRHTDLTGQDAIDALGDFTDDNFEFVGELLAGTDDADMLVGGAQSDFIEAAGGDDFIQGNGARDFITTGEGADVIAFAGDPFDGVDVSAEGRQVSGNEDFVSDFDFAADLYQLNAADGDILGGLSFVSLDANAPGADILDGANVIVLTNSDNDDNPETPFLAVTAAEQIAELVETPGAGYFVYFNSNLDMNRLVYSSDLSDPTADLSIVSRHTDLTGQDAIDALANFTEEHFVFEGEELTGTEGPDMLIGAGGSDTIEALAGDDYIRGNGGRDFIATGDGADVIAFAGDPFDGVDVSAEGRQVSGNEDFVSDFDFALDAYELNAADGDILGGLSFASLDANAPGADVPDGANVIVLTNSDNDDNPETPFLAVTAAEQIAGLVETPGAGYFVYFNSNLDVNRLVYSSDLSDPMADLSIVSRHTDLTGQDAIDALGDFTEGNFVFAGERLTGTDGADILIGAGGSDTIEAFEGDDFIQGNGGRDFISTGDGADVIAFADDPFDGVDVSAEGRQVSGNEDFVSDFDFASDIYQLNAADGAISGGLAFASLDANAPGADIPDGANVIVLTNSDNDDNPDTPFLAVTAAEQIAGLVETPGAGYFVYFNSNLDVNRLVYSSDLSDPMADLSIVSRHTDLTGQDAIDALGDFSASNFVFAGETLTGTDEADMIIGTGGSDTIEALGGDDYIFGNGGRDFIATGDGADVIAFAGDPFDGVDVSADGRQVSGNEDFVSDFDFASDVYELDADDFAVTGPLSFASLDANAPGADIPDGANVIVLTNSDNDDNPETPFLAVTAAEQIAGLVETPGAGFFVYFNSNLNVNRLAYSSDLSDPNADLSIISRHTDLTGQDAIDALEDFGASNFRLISEAPAAASLSSFTDLSVSEDVAMETFVPIADAGDIGTPDTPVAVDDAAFLPVGIDLFQAA